MRNAEKGINEARTEFVSGPFLSGFPAAADPSFISIYCYTFLDSTFIHVYIDVSVCTSTVYEITRDEQEIHLSFSRRESFAYFRSNRCEDNKW